MRAPKGKGVDVVVQFHYNFNLDVCGSLCANQTLVNSQTAETASAMVTRNEE
jgi:hypothetical protein